MLELRSVPPRPQGVFDYIVFSERKRPVFRGVCICMCKHDSSISFLSQSLSFKQKSEHKTIAKIKSIFIGRNMNIYFLQTKRQSINESRLINTYLLLENSHL